MLFSGFSAVVTLVLTFKFWAPPKHRLFASRAGSRSTNMLFGAFFLALDRLQQLADNLGEMSISAIESAAHEVHGGEEWNQEDAVRCGPASSEGDGLEGEQEGVGEGEREEKREGEGEAAMSGTGGAGCNCESVATVNPAAVEYVLRHWTLGDSISLLGMIHIHD
jgi:hypothetical protein